MGMLCFFFLLQLKSRWKWPCRLKITTTLKSWRISHRHNTRQSRKTLPRRYDLFSSFHLSILSLPIPFFFSSAPHFLLSSPILPPSFSFFLCSLFFPPVIPSFLSHSPPTFHSLSFFPLSLFPLSLFLVSPSALPSLFLFPSHSSPSFVSPPNTLPFLPPSPSLQSFLLPSSFSEFFPSSPQSVRTTYSTECLNNRLSPYMSPRQ